MGNYDFEWGCFVGFSIGVIACFVLGLFADQIINALHLSLP